MWLLFYFLLIKYHFWLFDSSEESSFGFVFIPQKRRIQSRRLLTYRQWLKHRARARSFYVLCFCRSALGVSCRWRHEARGQQGHLSATRPFCMLLLCMTACSWVSLVSLQAPLVPHAVQRQDLLAPTHCSHDASVVSRWPFFEATRQQFGQLIRVKSRL